MTNNLGRRLDEHRHGIGSQFTTRYNINRLVYYEVYDDIRVAITREKEIKDWRREKRVALIDGMNPDWKDLSVRWERCSQGVVKSDIAQCCKLLFVY